MEWKIRNINILGFIKRKILIEIARSYKNKRQFKAAELFYGKVLVKPNLNFNSAYYYEYADVLNRNKKFTKALEQLNKCINPEEKYYADYLVLRAQIHIKLKQYIDGERDMKNALELIDNDAFFYYILGLVLVLQNKWHEAEEALLIGQKLGYTTAKFFHRLGQASFAMGHYIVAADAYERAADKWSNKKKSVTKSDLYYMAGLSNEKLKKTETSFSFYKKTLKYDIKYNSEVLGIGIFHELNEEYYLAIQAYSEMEAAEPLFKLGMLYEKKDDKDKALESYKKVLDVNQINPEYHFMMGIYYENIQDYKQAVVYFKQAIARNSNFNYQWYLKLLNSLNKINETSEYRSVIDEINIINNYVNSVYRNGNNKIPRKTLYNIFYEELAIARKIILFESMTGARVSGNPLAIFEYMLKDKRFKDYTFVWSVNSYDAIPEKYKSMRNVIFAFRNTDLYIKYIATAHILINDSAFPSFYIKRDSQKYLNTWHGTPWKKLGYEFRTAKMDYDNAARNFIQATHLLVPNQYTYDTQIVSHQIASICTGETAITGYPRIDMTFTSMQNPSLIKDRLNLSNGKKIILYAPTWRGKKFSRSIDVENLKRDLIQLSSIDAQIIFRGHYLVDSLLQKLNIENITIVPSRFDINEVLGAVDILITDYSSVFFDFLVTDKPIIHYVYDYEEYSEERGLYFGLEALPGTVVQTPEAMIKTVKTYIDKAYYPTKKHLDAKAKYVYKDDGNVTKRVIDWFIFEKNNVEIVTNKNLTKKKILFHAGSFRPNGITSAFINMVKAIDKKKYDISVILSDTIVNYPERIKYLDKIQQDVNILPRAGGMNRHDEGLFGENLIKNGIFTDRKNQIRAIEYQKEYKRLFGKVEFDYIIDYSGYSYFYNQLLVSNPNPKAKNVVYVHNDIYSEHVNKYPTLNQVFEQYKQHDKVISVSEPTSNLNISNLSNKFNIPETKFDYVDNIQDPKDVIEKSVLEIEDKVDEKLFLELEDETVFITIGRLSAEKDQEKLIRAFEKVQKATPKASLLIIGEGPLKYQLQSVINELGLETSVLLLGRKANPYPYLKRADCFVLSSNYEGQPVVLFEALILDKPIIATDIISSRGVLQGGYGELCDNSIDGLVNAMSHFIAGKLHRKRFDIEEYNRRAIEMLYEKVF